MLVKKFLHFFFRICFVSAVFVGWEIFNDQRFSMFFFFLTDLRDNLILGCWRRQLFRKVIVVRMRHVTDSLKDNSWFS